MDKKLKLYINNDNYSLYKGNMLDMLDVIEPNSIDSIVTDPPYGLTSICNRFGKENSAPAQYGKDGAFNKLSKGFMGQKWDGTGIEYNIDTWRKCFEVLKPGGYLVSFGGARTYHRIAYAIENAGFEIRRCIMWLYGSGFPKSMNIGLAIDKKNGIEVKSDYVPNNKNNIYGKAMGGGKTTKVQQAQNEWNGWGTCLKPAYEPIIVARKPFDGSLVDNIIKNKVGGINIDECRIGDEYIKGGTMPDLRDVGRKSKETIGINKLSFGQVENIKRLEYEGHHGRFPTNVILTYDETDFDEVCGAMPNSGDVSTSRYFYCAKASKKDRDEGLDKFEEAIDCDRNPNLASANVPMNRSGNARKNIHPTVKPTKLMQYLIRLVSPRGSVILDPFMGSGSTGKAVMYENKERNANYKFIGIELTEEYLPIAEARINYASVSKMEGVC